MAEAAQQLLLLRLTYAPASCCMQCLKRGTDMPLTRQVPNKLQHVSYTGLAAQLQHMHFLSCPAPLPTPLLLQ
jgi:hypothetical protein